MERPELEFSLDGDPVGYFTETGAPTAPGRYRYMPYRGGGHYEMGQRFQSGESPRCELLTATMRVSFTALSVPEVHVMEIGEVDVQPRKPPAEPLS